MSKRNKLDPAVTRAIVMRIARDYIKPYRVDMGWAILMMLVAAAMTGLMAKYVQPIIDDVFTAKNTAMLWSVALSVLAIFVTRGLTTYGHTVLMNKLGQRIVSDMQRDMFAHLIASDLAYFHNNQSGQLLSRFISDTQQIRSAVTDTLTGAGKNFFTLIFLIWVMVDQDWKLSLFSLLTFPLAALAVGRLGKKLRSVSHNAQSETGVLTSMLGQAFQGNKHVKAYGMEDFEKKRINLIIENIFNLMHRSFRFSALASPIAEALSGLAVVAIIIYGGYQVMDGLTTAGKLFSFNAAFLMAFEPMKRLARLNNSMQAGLSALERMFAMLDAPPLIQNKAEAHTLLCDKAEIEFDHVGFTYADGTVALDDVSFVVPAGKTVALVGGSGAGKSTILNLVPRFYDVTSGAIRINQQDVRDVTLQSLRKNMALVSQEVAIFSDTIRENIAYGTEGATEESIVAAAKAAAAHEFILELPFGYDTRVGENGVKLSGGQRQRISIARAMLRNAPILLLDEATSALDTHSERLVQTALEKLQEGKTTVVVAHRLSTILNADIIFVMQDGRIAEYGTHDELLARNGIYARLYGLQVREAV